MLNVIFFFDTGYFWSVKNSLEILDKLHAKKYIGDFESVQSFDFSTLYTTLPHILIKKTFTSLINWAFKKSDLKVNKYNVKHCKMKQKASILLNEKTSFCVLLLFFPH